jgi:hypothetical protein
MKNNRNSFNTDAQNLCQEKSVNFEIRICSGGITSPMGGVMPSLDAICNPVLISLSYVQRRKKLFPREPV